MITTSKNVLCVFAVAAMCFQTVLGNGLLTGRRAVGLLSRDPSDGDGDCDPCLDSCLANHKRDTNETHLPMLDHDDDAPWKDGEAVRWRNVSKVNESGKVQLAFNLEFDCSQIKDVCNNMCFGVYCKTPANTFSLTIQRDNVAKCQAARKSNACGSSKPNYCSQKFTGTGGAFPLAKYSCDEYPFASTKEGQTGKSTATRCVPAGENSSQGGKISGLYRNGAGHGRLDDGTGFTVVLKNTGSSPNCGSYNGVGKKNCASTGTASGNSQK